MADKHSRRDFLVRSGSVLALGLLTPGWLRGVAMAQKLERLQGVSPRSQNVLVVCQLSGGNDGLNTVIPYSVKDYYRLRPGIGIPEKEQIPISDELALHPALKPLKALWDEGRLAIVNGAGYPEHNRSHFRSMKIWQTASPATQSETGWLGNYLDRLPDPVSPVAGLCLDSSASPALTGQRVSVPTIASLDDISELAGTQDAESAMRAIQQLDGSAQFAHVSASTNSALDAVHELNSLLGKYQNCVEYESDNFSSGFRQLARLIAVSPLTRVAYLSVGGFDTHASQQDKHATLLGGFASGLARFMEEMQAIGMRDKVTVLAFSEFGRRVKENGSGGTDHGQAGPIFIAGGSVQGGLHGEYPSLSDLDDGDLRYNTDFRRVYATLLDKWLDADSEKLLGQRFDNLPLLRS
ncbi:DUF1501 domain-containing protein [bacterium]|nr:DUF1501 domain-containing protein [bacterium]